MRIWSSSNKRKEIEQVRDSYKDKIEKSRITRNKYEVYILWIDEESAKKMWHGK